MADLSGFLNKVIKDTSDEVEGLNAQAFLEDHGWALSIVKAPEDDQCPLASTEEIKWVVLKTGGISEKETVFIKIPVEQFDEEEESAEEEEEESTLFNVEVYNTDKDTHLRFECLSGRDEHGFAVLYISSMYILDEANVQQEGVLLDGDETDNELEEHLKEFLNTRKISIQIVGLVPQVLKQYHLQEKQGWATKFLSFIS